MTIGDLTASPIEIEKCEIVGRKHEITWGK